MQKDIAQSEIRYEGPGFTITSEIALQGLPVSGRGISDDDLRIKLGEVKVSGSSDPRVPLFSFQDPQTVFLEIPETARFLISSGKLVVVDCSIECPSPDLSAIITGMVFSVICLQRGLVPIRAATLNTPQGAILLAGQTGSGKSALGYALQQAGYRVVGDDLAALEVFPGRIIAHPASRSLRLWRKDAEKVSAKTIGELKSGSDIEPRVLAPAGSYAPAQPVRAIYHLKLAPTVSEPLAIRGGDKLMRLNQLIYYPDLLGPMGLATWVFRTLSQLAARVTMYHFPVATQPGNVKLNVSHFDKLNGQAQQS